MDLPKAFKVYLKSQGVSPITVKNYLSDFNHFWGWLVLGLRSHGQSTDSDEAIISQVNSQTIAAYKEFLTGNETPIKTINRRLSTLRRLGDCCLQQGWLTINPARKIKNTLPQKKEAESFEKILNQFRAGLEKEKVSPVTIKNYLSDVRHFLAWVEVET